MVSFGLSGLLALVAAATGSGQTVIDDAAFTYTGDWTHDTNGPASLVDGTQSWSNDPSATFTFTFQGTGFDFCSGLKADRGPFTFSVDDGALLGQGSEKGPGMQQAPTCQTVATARGLEDGPHTVVFANVGDAYFAADAVTVYGTSAPASATVPVASSISSIATSASEMSGRALSQSASTTLAPAASSPAGILPVVTPDSSASSPHMSASKKAAIIALPILGGLMLAIFGFFIFIRHQRKKANAVFGPTATDNFDSLDFVGPCDRMHTISDHEKGFAPDQPPPSVGPVTSQKPMAESGRKSPLGFGGVFKQQHNRLGSQMSLESHTEPFQPEALRSPPVVEPFLLPDRPATYGYHTTLANHPYQNGQSVGNHPAINNVNTAPQPALMRQPSAFSTNNSAQRSSEISHYPQAVPRAVTYGNALHAEQFRTSDASCYAPTVAPPIEEDNHNVYAGIATTTQY